MNTNRSIKTYQNTLELQTESFVLTTYLIYTSIYSLIVFLIITLSYVFGIFLFKNSVKDKKELPDLSKKVSDIVGEEVKCYSVKSKMPNAFNAGGTNCYVTLPLVKMLTEKELIGVILHEYGHYHKCHLFKAFGVHVSSSILLTVITTLITNVLVGAPIVLSALLVLFFGKKVAEWYSKKKEFEADEIAVKYGYGKEFLSALKKLEVFTRKDVCKKLSKKDCEAYFTDLQEKSTTHPSFKDRYEKILNSPFFNKFIFYYASKVYKNGWDESMLGDIGGFVKKLISKVF